MDWVVTKNDTVTYDCYCFKLILGCGVATGRTNLWILEPRPLSSSKYCQVTKSFRFSILLFLSFSLSLSLSNLSSSLSISLSFSLSLSLFATGRTNFWMLVARTNYSVSVYVSSLCSFTLFPLSTPIWVLPSFSISPPTFLFLSYIFSLSLLYFIFLFFLL